MTRHQDTIAKQAAAHFARRRSASWSKSDEEAVQAWLREDPAHAAAWLEYEHLWTALESAKADPRVLAMRAEARGRASSGARTPGALRIRLTVVGLAATVLVGLALWAGLTHFRSGAVAGRIFTTGIGQRSEIVLADGSHVTLDTATTLRVDYSSAARLIVLERGQAYFEVAKNAAWPFVVAADDREVLATGTAFNVWKRPGGLQVVLVEGQVRVSRESTRSRADSAAPIYLRPGNMLTVGEGGATHVEQVNTDNAISWRSGRLVFEGERLGDAVAALNRYWRQRIVITDPALADRKITAVFATSTGAAGIARTLQTYGLARVVKNSPAAIYLAPP
jgi:transmembrane sensor